MKRTLSATMPLFVFVLSHALISSAFAEISTNNTVAPYTSVPIADIQLSREHRIAATVVSQNTTNMSSEIAATILQYHVRPGDRVQQGQPLVTLDCRDAEDQRALLRDRMAEIETDLAQSQRLANRLSTLRERQLTDTLSVEDALSDVTRQKVRISSVKTEIQLAERQVSRCRIEAPFEAAIITLLAGTGERSAPGTLLLSLQQLSDAEIEVSLPLHRFDIQAGLEAKFRTHESTQPVELLRQSSVVDAQSRSQKAWFTAPQNLPIGTSGELILTESKTYIPAEFIVSRSGILGVFLVQQDAPTFVPLVNAQEGRPYPLSASFFSEQPITESLSSKTVESVHIVIQGHQWLQTGLTP